MEVLSSVSFMVDHFAIHHANTGKVKVGRDENSVHVIRGHVSLIKRSEGRANKNQHPPNTGKKEHQSIDIIGKGCLVNSLCLTRSLPVTSVTFDHSPKSRVMTQQYLICVITL